MDIATLYGYIEQIGVMSFSTIMNDEVYSRSAHFNGFDEDGLYFRTMANKPYCRQLNVNYQKLTHLEDTLLLRLGILSWMKSGSIFPKYMSLPDQFHPVILYFVIFILPSW